MSVVLLVVAVLSLLVATVAVVCLFTPVSIAMRAPAELPGGGEALFLLEVRHPALLLDLSLDAATALGWVVGERKMPRFRAEVAGIRVREEWVEWAARKAWAEVVARVAGKKKDPRQEEENVQAPPASKKPGVSKIELAREILGGVRTIGDVERLVLKVEFGTGDPATTGMAIAGLLFLEPFLPEEAEIDLQPYWSELVVRIEGEGRAQLFPWRAVRAILSLALWRMRTGTAAAAMATAAAAPSNRS